MGEVAALPTLARTDGALAAYTAFLKAKVKLAGEAGFAVADDLSPVLKDHQAAIVRWAARGGRRAIFAAFGLGKSVVQLELVWQVARRAGGPGLIVAPLGVRQEFMRDAAMLGRTIKFVRSIAEVFGADLYLTNYETVRDGKLDPRLFAVASLDEASVLRGFGGSKTFREFMRLFDGVPFKFVATATPAPNEYIELLAYAAFLEVMDIGEAKTRFFKRDSENADHLTLHPHKVEEFWMWVSSWALFVQKPSDICGCPCHQEKRSSASGTASSKSSPGFPEHSATGPGGVAATAAASGSPAPTTCSQGASEVVDASALSTGSREQLPTPPGEQCSTGSITTFAMSAEASGSATDGGGSGSSSRTSGSPRPEALSNGSTTTSATSRETADGLAARNRRATPGEPSILSTTDAASRSLPGLRSGASSIGPCTPVTRRVGPSSGCSSKQCQRCAELDEGYALPPMEVIWHEVPVDHAGAGVEKSGQGKLFRDDAAGVVNAAREKRATLQARVNKAVEIVAADPLESYILWHDLEDERRALEAAFPTCVSVWGSQDLEAREEAIVAFSNGWVQYLAAKPVIAGSGCNFQRHCHKAVFLGVGFKFNDLIQAIHRIQRFLQLHPVEIHIIHAESERQVKRTLLAKWRAHEEMTAKMQQIIQEYGLSNLEMAAALTRSLGVERIEVTDPEGRFRLVNNDTVLETQMMEGDSVDLIVTSIPFSTQYEYSPSYNDFGHTESNAHFWEQMGFLIAQLHRVLRPGRVAAIHVKDRIVPGGMTGLGFQTVYPFADDCRRAFMAAGFAYLGEKTNLTDVVRENNQTYRLGWSEQCKDGSRMGAGLPEKVLLFRKAPSDSSNGYADLPVTKDKASYSRARWQLDAHHLSRSSGDRFLAPEEWTTILEADQTYRLWKAFNLGRIYDFDHHVRVGEALEGIGRLPPTFMLLAPHSWHDDVWTDVAQMLSLNTLQHQKGAETHLCPLPFDIVNRLITQFSMAGEIVFDPFGGLMTVPYCALKLGRRGLGTELNPGYFLDGVKHVEAMAREIATPTLFDALEAGGEPVRQAVVEVAA